MSGGIGQPYELSEDESLELFLRTRATLEPDTEVLCMWTGSIYAMISGLKSPKLFDFEGFNIARIIPAPPGVDSSPGSHLMLSREIGLYKDPTTGEILRTWKPPKELGLGEDNQEREVFHVRNDPVNGVLGKRKLPMTDLGDTLAIHVDIMLAYPSPLTVEEFPRNSQSNLYQAGELFNWFLAKKDIEDKSMKSLPSSTSWTRFGPWLPWMEMGQKPGCLVYQARGCKLMKGWEQLSPNVRAYVEKHCPDFKHAPTEYTKPNETSWTSMKKELLKRKLHQPVG